MDAATSTPVVRPAREEDAADLAGVITLALGDKYRPALGRAAARAATALVRRDIGLGGASRYLVGELDGRLAGGVRLVLASDSDQGYRQAMAREIGWLRTVRAATVFGLLGEGRLSDDEGYIDELAVAEWARRRGVARALLEACEREARRAGKRRLTLWVTMNNGAARTLYEVAGFRDARRRRWLVGRLLFRAPGAVFMEKRLPPP
jgi:ribosomal protein S18 acetylase RimI-like enzyme